MVMPPPDSQPQKPVKISQLTQELPIQKAFIGGCVGGKWEDMVRAAEILRNNLIAEGIQLIIQPATMAVYQKMAQGGLTKIFEDAGAVIIVPNCGGCIGQGLAQLKEGETGIFASTRNYKGRTGGEMWLGSPETVAASAIQGSICSPSII